MITLVSGLPRSGTSLMMQMLHAGGLPVLTDERRSPDANNPRGYFEYEKVKRLQRDKAWLSEAEGKVVKVISHLLFELPADRQYQVVFMLRDVDEVTASQAAMLERLGREGGAGGGARLAKLFDAHLAQVQAWLAQRPGFQVLYVSYPDVLEHPAREIQRIAEFLGRRLDATRMAAAVDRALYRQRRAALQPFAGG